MLNPLNTNQQQSAKMTFLPARQSEDRSTVMYVKTFHNCNILAILNIKNYDWHSSMEKGLDYTLLNISVLGE